MSSSNFDGLRVLALESRHGKELAKLIASYGGQPTVAPALREVPLESSQTQAFAAGLIGGQFHMVVFLTGSGARALITIVENAYSREHLCAALQKMQVVARGPKPVSVLNELGVKANLVAPEPNTWREVLQVLDSDANPQSVRGLRVAVQEYGTPCTELLEGLKVRGACVTTVPVYRWSLPEDTGPLREAAKCLANGDMDVVLFTSAVQVAHLFQVAAEMKIEESLRSSIERRVQVARINLEQALQGTEKSVLRHGESALAGPDGEFGARGKAQATQDLLNVIGGRALSDYEFRRNLLIGQSTCDKRRDVPLARCQRLASRVFV